MKGLGVIQKKIEDAIFDFIDTDLKNISTLNTSSRCVVYNEVVNLVEDKILALLDDSDLETDDLKEKLDTTEDDLEEARNAFDTLKSDSLDSLRGIKSDIQDVLSRLDTAIGDVEDSELW